jgi:hypothetical protein
LKASGADVFMNFTGPKFAAQAIKKLAELNWKPVHIINNPASVVGSVLKPAGLDISQGLITAGYTKDPTDPAMADDPGVKNYLAFVEKYYPGADITSGTNTVGYVMAQVMAHVLRRAGDTLTRENVMREAASIKDLEIDMLLPGIRVNTSLDNHAPLKVMQLRRFVGERWQPFGPVIDVAD